MGERFGHDPRRRPEGVLVWIHAASIGESLSVLPVVDRLLAADPACHVLVTTVTRTAAALMVEKLPPRAQHAFAPFDVDLAWRRFVERWSPDVVVVVEQELWPMMLAHAPAPRLLVNARLSAKSARGWQRFPAVAAWLLGRFERILAQSEADATRLRGLGAQRTETPGNLKDAAAPLTADAAALDELRAAIGDRPVWVAASTHDPEERWIADVHDQLAERFGDVLTVIVPRHPERGATIAIALARTDVALRSRDRWPDRETGIFVADSLGELGLFYRVATFAFVGGSLIPHGGQNPLEPARLGCPVLHGPHMSNFAEPARRLGHAGAAVVVDGPHGLANAASRWFADAVERDAAAGAARAATVAASGALDATVEAIRDAVGLGGR